MSTTAPFTTYKTNFRGRPINRTTAALDSPELWDMSHHERVALSLPRLQHERLQSTYQFEFTHRRPIRGPPVLSSSASSPHLSALTRYTPQEWTKSNQRHFSEAESSRAEAEHVRAEALRVIEDTDELTREAQEESGRRLNERISDIKHWKSELHVEAEALVAETEQLTDIKRRLERALQATETPMNVAKECLVLRENRQGIDLVHDVAQEALLDEVETIRRSQRDLAEAIRNVDRELDALRRCRYQVESDARNKFKALGIDSSSYRLRNESSGINFHENIEKVDHTVTTPESWMNFTHDNLQAAQKERAVSERMRVECHALIEETSTAMSSSWDKSSRGITRRLGETTEARNVLRDHLAKVMMEIHDVETHMELLKKGIADKMPPLKVAQTRLEQRTFRPDVELCRDPPQHRLIREVEELQSSVASLRSKLAEAEVSHQKLLKTKAKLESDIAIKEQSMFID
ncbi:unnamed protein product, partial [Cyprideis torosa]